LELKVSLIGSRTCASVSALSLEAQPAQLERLVNRICLPEEAFLFMGIMIPENSRRDDDYVVFKIAF